MIKLVYFVRHGEAVSNVTHVYYDPRGELTEGGRRQADFLGERFKSISVEKILASHYERAQETAQIINRHIHKDVETVKLLAEKRIPQSFIGTTPDDPKRRALTDTDPRHFDETFQHEDSETILELKNRACALLEYLVGREEKSLLCVTHGWFLRIVVAVMIHGKDLTSAETYRLWKFLKTINAGITLCEYDTNNLNGGWRLITWMDHAHLGEIPNQKGTT